jgi:HlyD family secretion protein
MKRVIPIFLILALLVGGYFAIRYYQQQQAENAVNNLQTVEAARGDLTATVGATGLVHANQTTSMAWQTSGIIEKVNARVGDKVNTEQVLASLKQTSLPQAVILAQADLVNAQKDLDTLKNSQMARAQALQAMDNAQKALNDLEENTILQQAQARDALLKAQDTYSKTLTAQNNLKYINDSKKLQDARASLEQAELVVTQLRQVYKSIPGDPKTNPAKAKAQIDLQIAMFKRDRFKELVDLYGDGKPTDQQLNQADSNVALAKAKLDDAQRAWDRIKDGPDPVQKALLEAQLSDAKREYERLKDGPDPSDIAALEARIAGSQATLATSQLVAPFAGTVTSISVMPGDQVTPGAIAFRLDDLSHLLVDLQVSEVDINRIDVGQDVTIAFDAINDKEYHGKVTEVADVGNNVQGVPQFTVTVEITDADQAVKPGMTAAVNVVVEQLKDVLLVPNRAVRVQNGQRVVYLLRDGLLSQENVTLGASSDVMSQLLEGNIHPGDLIVLNPPQVFDTSGRPSFMQRQP